MADMLQTTGKVRIKKKSEFRQTLKTLNVKYRKVYIFKNHLTWCRWRKKPEFPWHFSIFSVSCLFVLWLKRRLNLSFLDIAGLQHRGEQASPVFCRLGFGARWQLLSRGWTGCSCQRDLYCSHVTELALPSACRSLWGQWGWSLVFCCISIDPHRTQGLTEEGLGQELRGDEIEQEQPVFVTKSWSGTLRTISAFSFLIYNNRICINGALLYSILTHLIEPPARKR